MTSAHTPPTESPRIGVCSWSLRPGSADQLVDAARAAGLEWVHLALDPLRRGEWDADETAAALREAGIGIASGMMAMQGEDYSTLDSIRQTGGVRPDSTWQSNLAAARENAALARDLGLDLVTFHAGFIPNERRSLQRAVLIERLRTLADVFADWNVRIAFETGQETAETLAEALDEIDRPTCGVNFDPANMILYAMGDPVRALDRLADRTMQVHIKDAVPTEQPGAWGRETPAGRGAVDWAGLFEVVRGRGLDVGFMIEREAGGTRLDDVVAARDLVQRHLGTAP